MLIQFKDLVTVVQLMIFALVPEVSKSQFLEQELSNFGSLPDSTLRVEHCVHSGGHWYCSLNAATATMW